MKARKFKYLFIGLIVVALLLVSSCKGCSGASYATQYEQDKAASLTESKNQVEWVIEKLNLAKETAKENNPEITENALNF